MKNALQKAEELTVHSYEFHMSQYLSRGWEIFKTKPALFIGFSVIATLILATASFIPFATTALSAPLSAGFYLVARKIDLGKSVEFNDFFGGFNFFLQLLLLSVVMGIFVALGFVCLVIPGIYLAVAYGFGSHLIIFGNIEFWDAMEASRKVITKNWGSLFGFAIVCAFILLGGILALGVGVFVAYPWIACASYVAFADIFKLNNEEDHEDDILDHLVTE